MSENRAPHTEYVVEAVGLTKIFKDFWMRAKATAVDGISFNFLSSNSTAALKARAKPLKHDSII